MCGRDRARKTSPKGFTLTPEGGPDPRPPVCPFHPFVGVRLPPEGRRRKQVSKQVAIVTEPVVPFVHRDQVYVFSVVAPC